jgi:hypothetical protein
MVNPAYITPESITICNGDNYNWHGSDYSASGTYCDSFLTVSGCDSVFILNLTVNPTYLFHDSISICYGGTYTWRGNDYSTTGTYYDSLLTISGCDSIFLLNLTVNPVFNYSDSIIICYGDSYTWHGSDFSVTGIYYDSLQTVHGCDSVYRLTLTLSTVYYFSDSIVICSGDTLNWHGSNYSTAGIYYDSLQTIHGCDSVYVLTLAVNPSYNYTDSVFICSDGIYNWHGSDYSLAGIYYDSLQTVHGCDSIYTLVLAVSPVYHFSDSIAICNGEVLNWHGNDYAMPGTYYDSLLSVYGCDSVYVMSLAVFYVDTSLTVSDTSITANATGTTYQWADCDNGYAPIAGEINQVFTAFENGNFAVIITQSGCTDTSACVPITSIGILENTFRSNIILFPNPTDGELTLDVRCQMSDVKCQKFVVEVYDISGQLLMRENASGKTVFDISDYNDGMYFVSIITENGVHLEKLVINR